MKLSTLLLAGSVLATASAEDWSLEHLIRWCYFDNRLCLWEFSINTGVGTPSFCMHAVASTGAKLANEHDGCPTDCGDFRVTSGWSGQFGPGEGFTTLSVINTAQAKVAFFSYKDTEVESGAVSKHMRIERVTQWMK